MPRPTTREITYTALFAALIAVGALVSIPITTVPFTLQVLFVLLAGMVLGPRLGALAVIAYLLLGLIAPVYAGGTSGLGALFGPTGGYLWGFLPAVVLTGLLAAERPPHPAPPPGRRHPRPAADLRHRHDVARRAAPPERRRRRHRRHHAVHRRRPRQGRDRRPRRPQPRHPPPGPAGFAARALTRSALLAQGGPGKGPAQHPAQSACAHRPVGGIVSGGGRDWVLRWPQSPRSAEGNGGAQVREVTSEVNDVVDASLRRRAVLDWQWRESNGFFAYGAVLVVCALVMVSFANLRLIAASFRSVSLTRRCVFLSTAERRPLAIPSSPLPREALDFITTAARAAGARVRGT